MSIKNSNDTSWDRTSDLPICSTARINLCLFSAETVVSLIVSAFICYLLFKMRVINNFKFNNARIYEMSQTHET